MSFLSSLANLFGCNKKREIPPREEAVHKLRSTEEMLIKKQELIVEKIEQERATAKKNSTINKRAAIQALERKKRYEKQLAQVDGIIDTVEQQRDVLEGAITNADVLTTLKTAEDKLKLANQFMSVDNVHKMINDIEESQELSKELSEAISNPVAFGSDIYEDALQKELEELEREEFDKHLLKAGIIPVDLPASAIPTFNEMARAKTKVQEELVKLHYSKSQTVLN